MMISIMLFDCDIPSTEESCNNLMELNQYVNYEHNR